MSQARVKVQKNLSPLGSNMTWVYHWSDPVWPSLCFYGKLGQLVYGQMSSPQHTQIPLKGFKNSPGKSSDIISICIQSASNKICYHQGNVAVTESVAGSQNGKMLISRFFDLVLLTKFNNNLQIERITKWQHVFSNPQTV